MLRVLILIKKKLICFKKINEIYHKRSDCINFSIIGTKLKSLIYFFALICHLSYPFLVSCLNIEKHYFLSHELFVYYFFMNIEEK